MARMSPQRRDVKDLIAREGSASPARVADVLGMSPGAARKLLYMMYSDDELESPERGRYTLSAEPSVTFEGGTTADVTGDVTETVDVTEDVTDMDKSRIDMPILGESPSGTWGYSQSDGAMIPVEVLRRRKGYSG